jgi:hypothetical protein
MVRINLLPPYIYAGAKRRNVSILWVVMVLAVVGGFMFWKVTIDTQTAKIIADKEAIQPQMDEAKRLQAEADRILAESADITKKRDFVADARKHLATTYPPLIDNVRKYTMKNVLYSQLTPSGQTVSLSGYATSLAQVGHYMMWMERNPAINSLDIGLSGIPSFPVTPGLNGNGGGGLRPPGAGGYDFTVTLNLVKPVAGAPSYAGAAGGGAQQAGGGMMGGAPMGMGGAPMGMSGAPMMGGGAAGSGFGPGTGGGMMGPGGPPSVGGKSSKEDN